MPTLCYCIYLKIVYPNISSVEAQDQNVANKEDMIINDSVFREYDIRGIVEQELPIEATYDLTSAIVAYFKQKNPTIKQIALAIDGRVHSPAIKEQVCKAVTDAGIDVLYIGVCPTPALYFSQHTTTAQAGIMITASHNPKEYNGFKLCLNKESVCGNAIREIRTLYSNKAKIVSNTKGTVIDEPIHNAYISWLTNQFSHLKDLELPIVMDCGNGVAGTIIPELVHRLGFKNVTILYADVDGTYPHHDADPTIEKNMEDVKQALATTSCELGLGFDGDADRVAAMTKEGYLVPGDKLLALLAKPIILEHKGATVVCDVTSSSALLHVIECWGGHCSMVPTGHASIKAAMKKEHALIGGELSCHFTFADRYFGFDDGIYAALRLIEYIHTSRQPLTDLVNVFPTLYSSPSIRIPCDCTKITQMIDTVRAYFAQQPDTTLLTIDGIRVTTPYGWGLIRASNTQPVISLRFESSTPEGLEHIRKDFARILAPYFDQDTLSNYLG
jgi:phosphomannomutase/phosphoglucomutase